MTESAQKNLVTLVKPWSTWVIISKTEPTIPNDLLDQVYTLVVKVGQMHGETLLKSLCL
jgi:hypothetical protein